MTTSDPIFSNQTEGQNAQSVGSNGQVRTFGMGVAPAAAPAPLGQGDPAYTQQSQVSQAFSGGYIQTQIGQDGFIQPQFTSQYQQDVQNQQFAQNQQGTQFQSGAQYQKPQTDYQSQYQPGYQQTSYQQSYPAQAQAQTQQYQVPQYAQPIQQPYAPVQPQKLKKRKGKGFWIAIVVALICVAVAAVLAINLLGEKPSSRQGSRGQLEGKSAEEIQAELDRVVEEGMFNISIASMVEFENGTSEGEFRIENVPGNHYLMKVVITRDDTGEVVYTTDFIEPDFHIQRDTLDVPLPQGLYDCTAVFSAYDVETEEPVGEAAAKMTIKVAS